MILSDLSKLKLRNDESSLICCKLRMIMNTFLLALSIMCFSNFAASVVTEVDIFTDRMNARFTLTYPPLVVIDFGQMQGFSYNQLVQMTAKRELYYSWRMSSELKIENLWLSLIVLEPEWNRTSKSSIVLNTIKQAIITNE
jgi:hypothetical protein